MIVYDPYPGDYTELFKIYPRCCDDPLIEMAIDPRETDEELSFYGVIMWFHCFGCGGFFAANTVD